MMGRIVRVILSRGNALDILKCQFQIGWFQKYSDPFFSFLFSLQSSFCLFIVHMCELNLSPYQSKLQPTFCCLRSV